MTRLRLTLALGAALLLAGSPAVRAKERDVGPAIRTVDVERFYRIYEAAHGAPTAQDLQANYLDAGSEGLHQFVGLRHVTGESLAKAIAKRPEIFAKARSCLPVLPGVRVRLKAALAKLARIDPQASFPPVTLLVGEGRTGGTTSPDGVLIGLETICTADWMEPDLESRFVHLIAHEYGHVQQPAAATDPKDPTLLFTSLIEGGAELIGEMISGEVGNVRLARWAEGREGEVERQFLADADKTDLKAWLYNGKGTAERPGDLGYWVGYRITKAYYVHARDKRRAIQDILHIDPSNAKAFLANSGWTPGMTLPAKVAPPA